MTGSRCLRASAGRALAAAEYTLQVQREDFVSAGASATLASKSPVVAAPTLLWRGATSKGARAQQPIAAVVAPLHASVRLPAIRARWRTTELEQAGLSAVGAAQPPP